MAAEHYWPCEGFAVDEASAQPEIASYFLNLKFGLYALEPKGLARLRKCNSPPHEPSIVTWP